MKVRTFSGTLDSLAPVREYVADAARAAGLDGSSTYKLCLAVDEIATNVMLHGYEEAGLKGDIVVEAIQEPGRLVIRVLDQGRPYDPALASEPDVQRPLLERQAGGLGLFLAKQGVDQLDYSSSDRGNIHTFIVLLPGNDSQTKS
jgi:anti-sigma regulatory factor (Ser/Thr protein kinase)